MAEASPFLGRLAYHYLHQDWDVEGEEPDDILRSFANYEPPDSAQAAVVEVGQILAEDPSEDDLRHLWLREWKSGFLPPGGMSFREWFQHIADVLRSAL